MWFKSTASPDVWWEIFESSKGQTAGIRPVNWKSLVFLVHIYASNASQWFTVKTSKKRIFATRHHGISKAEGSCGLLSNVTGMKLFGDVVFFFRSTCFARVYLGFAFLHQCVNDHALPMWPGAFLYIQTGVEDLSTLQHRSYVAWFWSNFKRQIRQQLKFSSHDFHVTHAISAGDLGAFFYPPAHHWGWRAPIHQDTHHTFLEALSADLALCMAGRRHWDLRYYRCDALPRPSNQSTNQSKALSWEHEPIAWLCHSTCSNWTNLWYEVQPGIRNRYVGSNLHVSQARFCHSQFCSAGATSFVAFTCVPGLGIETWHELHDFPRLSMVASGMCCASVARSPPSQIRSLSQRHFAEGRVPSGDIFGHPEQIETYFLPLYIPSRTYLNVSNMFRC